jgi:hypothetical protein
MSCQPSVCKQLLCTRNLLSNGVLMYDPEFSKVLENQYGYPSSNSDIFYILQILAQTFKLSMFPESVTDIYQKILCAKFGKLEDSK